MGFSKLVINDYRVKDFRIQRIFDDKTNENKIRPSKLEAVTQRSNVEEDVFGLSPVKLNRKNFDSLPDLSPS